MRVSRVLVAVCAALLAVPAAATAADLTPEGPATLWNRYTGVSTSEGRPPEVLVGARVTVGEGGRAGFFRVLARMGTGPAVVSRNSYLPAEPQTFTVTLPPLRWDYRAGRLGIEQDIGAHALITQHLCQPDLGRLADPCQTMWLDGPAEGPRAGAQLSIVPIAEPDVDEDLLGDIGADVHDLQIRAAATTPERDGRLRTEVFIYHPGPYSTATWPTLKLDLPAGITARWDTDCLPPPWGGPQGCRLAPLDVGASRRVVLYSEPLVSGTIGISVASETTDLTPADNATSVKVAAAPPVALRVERKQSAKGKATLAVRAPRGGRVRVTASYEAGGVKRRVSRVVTLPAFTLRDVTLRLPGAAKARRLRVELSARRVSGGRVAKATTTVS